jgi:uncharacterized membrane protein
MTGLVLLVLIGAGLRVYQLDSGLWVDEIYSLLGSVRPSLASIVTHFSSNNDHALYSVLAHLSITLFGEHAWTLRLPALIFGIASLPMLYLVGSAVTSRYEALLATAMMTFSYHHVWFTQNARGYTALLFWTLLCTFLLLHWFQNRRGLSLAAYAVVAALGAYTHLTMVLVVVSHALICAWVLFIRRPRELQALEWRPVAMAFIGSGLLTVFLYAPVLGDMHAFFTTDLPDSKNVATPLWALLAAAKGLQAGFGQVWAVAIAAAISGLGLLGYYRQHRIALWLFLLPAPVTLVIALTMGRPVHPRFFLFLMGFLLLILVRGATLAGAWAGSRLRSRGARRQPGMLGAATVAAGFIALSVKSLPYGYAYPKQDYLQAMEYVERNRAVQDHVAAIGQNTAVPFIDYLGQPWQLVEDARQFRQLRAQGQTVWALYTLPAYVESNMPGVLEEIDAQCEHVTSFHGTLAGGDIFIYKCPPIPMLG